jgi:dTDP-D-glucose 4,6-dehydratase
MAIVGECGTNYGHHWHVDHIVPKVFSPVLKALGIQFHGKGD